MMILVAVESLKSKKKEREKTMTRKTVIKIWTQAIFFTLCLALLMTCADCALPEKARGYKTFETKNIELRVPTSGIAFEANESLKMQVSQRIKRSVEATFSIFSKPNMSPGQENAKGSCVVVYSQPDKKLECITAFHVADGVFESGAKKTVWIYGDIGGKDYYYEVSPIILDARVDLALLKATTAWEGPDIAVPISSTEANKGEKIYIIGANHGTHAAVTRGIVTAKVRCMKSGSACYRVDAALGPGNSGGGLYSLSGRLYGIVIMVQHDEYVVRDKNGDRVELGDSGILRVAVQRPAGGLATTTATLNKFVFKKWIEQ